MGIISGLHRWEPSHPKGAHPSLLTLGAHPRAVPGHHVGSRVQARYFKQWSICFHHYRVTPGYHPTATNTGQWHSSQPRNTYVHLPIMSIHNHQTTIFNQMQQFPPMVSFHYTSLPSIKDHNSLDMQQPFEHHHSTFTQNPTPLTQRTNKLQYKTDSSILQKQILLPLRTPITH